MFHIILDQTIIHSNNHQIVIMFVMMMIQVIVMFIWELMNHQHARTICNIFFINPPPPHRSHRILPLVMALIWPLLNVEIVKLMIFLILLIVVSFFFHP